MNDELEPTCSARGCRNPATWQLRWNNPRLHTPERRKTWLSCDEHRARLEANPALPAFRATTIVAVADRDLGELEHRVGVLEGMFRAAEFNFYRPTGAQLACFTTMLPGASVLPVVREYAQDLLPDGLASAMPFAGSGVGDPEGMLLG